MPTTKRIVCLANSRKMSGRCVAGREVRPLGPGTWIRPVSTRPNEEVSEYERQYENGSEPRVLDIVDVPVTRHHPHACQTENWILDPDYYWTFFDRIDWVELQRYVESPPTLWTNGNSTKHGTNDAIFLARANALPNSLVLIHVATLELRVFAPGAAYGNEKRRVQASFSYRGISYALWITDPVIELEYLAQRNGTYEGGEGCLCVSLGEPFQSCRYKLVAAVVLREGIQP